MWRWTWIAIVLACCGTEGRNDGAVEVCAGASGVELSTDDGTFCVFDADGPSAVSCPPERPVAHGYGDYVVCTAGEDLTASMIARMREVLPYEKLPCDPPCDTRQACVGGICECPFNELRIEGSCINADICFFGGYPCSVGVGVCEVDGETTCSWDGAYSELHECLLQPEAPEAPACDCEDDDCDGLIDEVELTMTPQATRPAQPAPWALAVVAGQPYAAFMDVGAARIIIVGPNGDELATVLGTQPRLLARHDGSLALFYLAESTVAPVQGELHAVAVSPLDGTLGATRCLSCAEPARHDKGTATAFQVVDASCTTEGPSPCSDGASSAFVVPYLRADGQVYVFRVDDATLDLEPGSQGLLLAAANEAVVALAVDPSVAQPRADAAPGDGLVAVAMLRASTSGHELVVLVASSLQPTQAVVQVTAATELAADASLAVQALGGGDVLVVYGASTGLAAVRVVNDGGVLVVSGGPWPVATTEAAHPQVVVRCNDSVTILFETFDGEQRRLTRVALDLSTGALETSAAAVPGTWPVLGRSVGGPVAWWGALHAAEPVTTSSELRPGFGVLCDA